ncbi:hypothetical protein [Mandarin fish ranavirus]|nr:hypothetical protein [Mandarin fish ranavirus]
MATTTKVEIKANNLAAETMFLTDVVLYSFLTLDGKQSTRANLLLRAYPAQTLNF